MDYILKKDIIQKVVNKSKFENRGKELGDCVTASLKIWFKLKSVGAVRMRGKRDLERRIDSERPKDRPHFHYWVESKGKVFEEHCGILQIFSVEDFYRFKSITDTEKCEYNGFHFDELDTDRTRKIVMSANNDSLLRLIIMMCIKMGVSKEELKRDFPKYLDYLGK